MLLDAELLGDELAVLIREHVVDAMKPLLDEIATLKASLAAFVMPKDGKDADPELVRAEVARAVESQPKPRDGRDADPEEIRAEIARQLAMLPRPRDGKDFDPAALDVALARATEEMHGFIAEQVDKRIAALPKGIDEAALDIAVTMAMRQTQAVCITEFEKRLSDLPTPIDGKDGADADPEFIRATIATEMALLPKPADGKSIDPTEVAALIETAVSKIPAPKDGKSVDVEEVETMVAAEVAKCMATIAPPKDGKSVDPQAVATMIRAEVERVVAEMPTPADGTDGEPGRDGHDGVQLEDIDIEVRGDRTLVFSMMSGGKVVEKEVKLPWPIDRGTFRSGKPYEKGDCVTYAGQLWIATGDTSEAPGVGPAALWRMAVKRGKDGRGADAS